MVVRQDKQGQVVTVGTQIEIHGKDPYVFGCRRHFKASCYGED